MATYNAKTLTLVNQNGDVFVIDPLQGNESVYLDLPVTIAQNQWSGTAPYTYTYTNSHITANAALCVYFKDGVREGLVGDLKWSKATGSITFVTTEPAAGPVPLVVRVIDSTTNGTYPIDAEMIETDAVIGETNVQGALEDLDYRVGNLVSCTAVNVKAALGTGSGVGKFLREDGTWDIPPGSKPVVVELDSVSDPGGTHYYRETTTNLSLITAGMKAIQIEVSNPDAFQDAIIIEVDDNEITLECNKVVDDSDVYVTCILVADANEANPLSITSSEFDILAARIANLEAVGTDFTFTIDDGDWAQSDDVYIYNWMNNKVTTRSRVKVAFFSGAEATTIPYLSFEKITGGVRFTAPSEPTEDIPVVVTVYNVKEDVNQQITGDMVQTSAISGAVNVDEALETISEQIAKLSPKIVTTRVIKTGTIAANSDVSYTENDILSAASVSPSKLITIFSEGMRPTASWNEVRAFGFYNRFTTVWGFHNIGTGGAFECTFIVVYKAY